MKRRRWKRKGPTRNRRAPQRRLDLPDSETEEDELEDPAIGPGLEDETAKVMISVSGLGPLSRR